MRNHNALITYIVRVILKYDGWIIFIKLSLIKSWQVANLYNRISKHLYFRNIYACLVCYHLKTRILMFICMWAILGFDFSSAVRYPEMGKGLLTARRTPYWYVVRCNRWFNGVVATKPPKSNSSPKTNPKAVKCRTVECGKYFAEWAVWNERYWLPNQTTWLPPFRSV